MLTVILIFTLVLNEFELSLNFYFGIEILLFDVNLGICNLFC